MKTACEKYRDYLETLTMESLNQLSDYVSKDVRFKDPFNDVRGITAMKRVLTHMFKNVAGIKFTVHNFSHNDKTCFMDWSFAGMLKGKAWSFDGASVIIFSSSGLVIKHTDYWDAAQNFYERIPIIGSLLAWFRQKIATH
jgi:steroid delta-isomerase